MERLVIYDADKLDCAELYRVGNDASAVVVAERPYPLTPETADETATLVAVFASSRVNGRVLARMPHVRLVMCLSTGTDHVDLKECAARGVTVCNMPAYGERTVAEYAMGLMLSLSRRLPEAMARLRDGEAQHVDLVGMDLAGKTLTVVGTGRIGRNVITYARAFGMTVLGVDARPDEAAAAKLGFAYVGLHEGLRRADVLSLHTPLTPETRHLINRRSLAIVKPELLVVNTARGELVETTALLHALHTQRLGGAALDVIEDEQLLGGAAEMAVLDDGRVERRVLREVAEHEALLKLPNVIITNHNAYNTHEAQARIAHEGATTIEAFLHGQPVNVVRG